MLLTLAPTTSRSLAARLAQEATRGKAGGEGMSAVARRLHCGACGGLLIAPGGTVRVARLEQRKGRRARRGTAEVVRNKVVRTCGGCGAANVHDGARKGGSGEREWVRLREEAAIYGVTATAEAKAQEEDARCRATRKKTRGVKRSSSEVTDSIFDGSGDASAKKKRKKKKKVKRDEVGRKIVSGAQAERHSQGQILGGQAAGAGIAGSFLFQPL
jgi:hypothetical protein